MSRNGLASPAGVTAKSAVGNPKAFAYVCHQINEFCRQPYTRAVAWCLFHFADFPKMFVPEICDWLDQIGAASPQKNVTWEHYCTDNNNRNLAKMEKMVSVQRKFLEKKFGRWNH